MMNKTPPPKDEVPLYVRYFEGLPVCERYPEALDALLILQHGQQLVDWVDQWACDEDWSRARDSVRAYRYKMRHHLSRANIDHRTKQLLGQRAKALGLPIWQYIQQLGLDAETLEALEKRSLQSKDCSKSC